jgi:hypothetical protein
VAGSCAARASPGRSASAILLSEDHPNWAAHRPMGRRADGGCAAAMVSLWQNARLAARCCESRSALALHVSERPALDRSSRWRLCWAGGSGVARARPRCSFTCLVGCGMRRRAHHRGINTARIAPCPTFMLIALGVDIVWLHIRQIILSAD